MPTISSFYGIVITMFFNDHDPPHFHARCEGRRARFEIHTGEPMDGGLPVRAERLVRQWALLHRVELEEDWRLAQALEPLNSIDPLP